FNLMIHHGYADGVLKAGALPVMLPLTDDEDVLEEYIARCDGFLFAGGPDVDPAYYNETVHPKCGRITAPRDTLEIRLMRSLLALQKPVLGICRGIQVMNVVMGGTLYQDLNSEYADVQCEHMQRLEEYVPVHRVDVTPHSRLHEITGNTSLTVNSLHHQAVKTVGKGLTVCAVSEDGLVEGLEVEGHPFFLGVQWHPERMFTRDSASLALFEGLIQASLNMKA
ncbi:MAG: gamma-glutamyl-gamma-aminobutyrate hydrolase family protein, partial [Clostridia bacterium]|nr:gamma-glutamyl-gamma-aminobutyrate hydrolase family protein [Clostridia bacterium]